MKLTRIKIILAAALALAGALPAGAQSNGVPGDTSYSQFSQFIANRNIFDPARYPRNTTRPRPIISVRQRVRTAGAPQFTFVGAMSYSKGLFGFFDGSSYEYQKVLAVGGSIAGYTVTEVTTSLVKLLGPDKKEVVLNLGDQIRQEGGAWEVIRQAALPGATTTTETLGGGGSSESAAPAAESAPAPSSAVQGNERLQELMKKRAQELK
jgi:hypothetical protein